MKHLPLILLLLLFEFPLFGQDTTALPQKLSISGYLKDLQSLDFDKNFRHLISGNLIHNRINVKWKPSGKITAVTELRNRLFWGEEVRLTPGFVSLLRNENELVNLQATWIKEESLVLHTNVERLYADYLSGNWNLRLGRQRINWGIGTTWNPNDIFNAFNFLDFDYEERPGADGARLKYIFNSSFNTELAFSHTGKKEGSIIALKYALNKWNYDMQLITGWYKGHPTVGAGWAGNLKDAGFKGEVQYYFPVRDSSAHFNLAMESDYMFKQGWYLNFSFLYNDRGLSAPLSDWSSINLKLSPENPMPTKWNFILSSSKELTPLWSANLAALYAPGTRLLILLPSLQFSLATNLDTSLVWQSYFADFNNHFEAANHRAYLRLKWSF